MLATFSEDPRDAVKGAHSLVHVDKVGTESSDSGGHGQRMDPSRNSKACRESVARPSSYVSAATATACFLAAPADTALSTPSSTFTVTSFAAFLTNPFTVSTCALTLLARYRAASIKSSGPTLASSAYMVPLAVGPSVASHSLARVAAEGVMLAALLQAAQAGAGAVHCGGGPASVAAERVVFAALAPAALADAPAVK